MFDRGMDAALTGFLFLFAPPLLALDTLLAKLNRRGPAAARRILARCGFTRLERYHSQSPHQFCFDRAIKAYEDLIDATLGERQA
jgi:hypothetical protein